MQLEEGAMVNVFTAERYTAVHHEIQITHCYSILVWRVVYVPHAFFYIPVNTFTKIKQKNLHLLTLYMYM